MPTSQRCGWLNESKAWNPSALILAMGFLKPQQPEFAENVFVAGDAANGASLVVRAMASGRKIAAQVDKFLSK